MTGAATAGWRVPLAAALSLLPRQVQPSRALAMHTCLLTLSLYPLELQPGHMPCPASYMAVIADGVSYACLRLQLLLAASALVEHACLRVCHKHSSSHDVFAYFDDLCLELAMLNALSSLELHAHIN